MASTKKTDLQASEYPLASHSLCMKLPATVPNLRNFASQCFENSSSPKCNSQPHIVAKKWDPGILDPSRFSGQIRKVEARLGKLAKIRKVETN